MSDIYEPAPKKVTVDGTSLEEHSLADKIAYDKYKKTLAASTSKTGGMRVMKIVPPGTI